MEEVFGPAQPVVLARELTKLHEEFLRGPIAEVRAALAARNVRGEMVLLIEITERKPDSAAERVSIGAEVAALMKADRLSEKDALKRVAKERGIGKSEAYRELQREQGRLR
jgi:16S rRNA (cytidine1402-2'-O)-methyltransferase